MLDAKSLGRGKGDREPKKKLFFIKKNWPETTVDKGVEGVRELG